MVEAGGERWAAGEKCRRGVSGVSEETRGA